jgi:non-heme chloroperoxidase
MENGEIGQTMLNRRTFVAALSVSTAATLLPQSAIAANSMAEFNNQHKAMEEEINMITVKDGTTIYYKDWGAGEVVLFSHDWPPSADAWDPQMLYLGHNGYRVIAHDRRGHGRSSQPWNGC